MPRREDYVLKRIDGRLELCLAVDQSGAYLDLDDVRRRSRQGRRLALAKACGVRPALEVVDAMAGFGLDGITLATLGCNVVMVERDPLLFRLLEDAVARARAELAPAGSIECAASDAGDVLNGDRPFDVVYLDPMFPVREKHALPRKSAQLLAQLVDVGADDLIVLIARARAVARSRVVLKRRRHDAVVVTPDWQIFGRSVRFDVYRGSAESTGV